VSFAISNLSHLEETGMSKVRPTIGTDGLVLPILPPERDARVWARLVRVMFYTPGFMGLLLIKTGEPASFGVTVELLMLSSRIGTWSGSLVIELLGVVPFLDAVPALFHELAHSALLHSRGLGAVDVTLGASELLPAVAILPFMIYQLAGFGTMSFVVPKALNWVINIVILCLIVASYVAYREGNYGMEKWFDGLLVVAMATAVLFGVLKLRQMQATYDAHCPPKEPK
jgi:hypothetical protein